MTEAHTPTPWRKSYNYGASRHVVKETGGIIAVCEEEADADLIVLAVNSHARLLKEREELRQCLEFYSTARVVNPSPEMPYNCDDGAYARATLLTLKSKD